MLKIAVCDDELACLWSIDELAEEYRKRRPETELLFCHFLSPSELLDRAEKGESFDVFLLDVYMPGMTGVAAARELRGMDIKSPVIFLTTSREHALEAFGVGATQYLLKPVQKEAFFEAMDTALERLSLPQSRQIVLKADSAWQSITVDDIVYTEAQNNMQGLVLKDGSRLEVRMTVGELFGLLGITAGFVRCGAAYIINLDHVRRIRTKEILLSNGTELKVPRGAYPKLREAYFTYYSTRDDI